MANSHSLDLELSSSQYAYIADANQTGLDITGDITIECWIKLESLSTTAGVLYTLPSKYDNSDYKRSFLTRIETDGSGGAYLQFLYTSDGSFATNKITLLYSSTNGVTASSIFKQDDIDQWVYVAIAVDVSAKTAVFYKNTTAYQSFISATYYAATAIANTTVNFSIGANYTQGTPRQYFDGLIDEVRVSNIIRDSTYIVSNYNQEITPDANHVAYWKLNNSALDETSNNNDLTLVNSPSYSTDKAFTDKSAALTGTITSSATETDIVNGGKTIILTLTGDTWVASGATFDGQRQNIIDGIDSAQSEATGWDAEVKANMAVTEVVRTSDTVVTITLAAQAAYNITATETITATIPATALTGNAALVASPTFTITAVSAGTVIHHLGLLGVGK